MDMLWLVNLNASWELKGQQHLCEILGMVTSEVGGKSSCGAKVIETGQ